MLKESGKSKSSCIFLLFYICLLFILKNQKNELIQRPRIMSFRNVYKASGEKGIIALNDRISTINLWSATCPFQVHLFFTWRILSYQRDYTRTKQHFIKHSQYRCYTQEFFSFQKNHTAMLNCVLQFGNVEEGVKNLKKSWYNQQPLLLNR